MQHDDQTGWAPPPGPGHMRGRADRQAQAVAEVSAYLRTVDPEDMSRWMSPWARHELRRQLPGLVAWAAAVLDGVSGPRRRP